MTRAGCSTLLLFAFYCRSCTAACTRRRSLALAEQFRQIDARTELRCVTPRARQRTGCCSIRRVPPYLHGPGIMKKIPFTVRGHQMWSPRRGKPTCCPMIFLPGNGALQGRHPGGLDDGTLRAVVAVAFAHLYTRGGSRPTAGYVGPWRTHAHACGIVYQPSFTHFRRPLY